MFNNILILASFIFVSSVDDYDFYNRQNPQLRLEKKDSFQSSQSDYQITSKGCSQEKTFKNVRCNSESCYIEMNEAPALFSGSCNNKC